MSTTTSKLRDHCDHIDTALWEIPATARHGMNVPVRVYATRSLYRDMDDDVFEQAANVAKLPGIVGYSFCMPDGHKGYGFPIGGVAAFDPASGIISPGGIGFDINCGMRLIRTGMTLEEVKPKLEQLVDALFERVPAGAGGTGLLKISRSQFADLIEGGARWCVSRGYGWEEDLRRTEEGGRMSGADAGTVSSRAIDRGYNQVGTLGSGNHYLEIQVVRPENIVDEATARSFGIDRPYQIVLMLHTGSRGFGHQVAGDYLQRFLAVMNSKYHLGITDRELAAAPFDSPEGRDYFAAMQCAVNMAFANRQMILHRIREVFSDVFHRSPEELGLHQVYDVTHNTARIERHRVEGREMELLVHRKGATRSFAAGMPDIPPEYGDIGQPVIIGGSMETGSYLLVGAETGAPAFFTTAHGSGRTMGRRQAKRSYSGQEIRKQMERAGIYVKAKSMSGLAEEAGAAYKNIDEVVEAAEVAGLSRRVVKLIPIGNVKG